MAQVLFHFTADFDYTPKATPHATLAYLAGLTLSVDEATAKAAEKAGRGERVKPEGAGGPADGL